VRQPEERRVVLIGPAAEFTPEHRQQFVHATTVPAAEAHLARILTAHGFTLRLETAG
jgi:hypothetical protein